MTRRDDSNWWVSDSTVCATHGNSAGLEEEAHKLKVHLAVCSWTG